MDDLDQFVSPRLDLPLVLLGNFELLVQRTTHLVKVSVHFGVETVNLLVVLTQLLLHVDFPALQTALKRFHLALELNDLLVELIDEVFADFLADRLQL